MQYEIITRNAALERGERKYFTNRPCIRGHVVPRYTVTSACIECVKSYHKASMAKVRDRMIMNAMEFKKVEIEIRMDQLPIIREVVDFLNDCTLHPDGTDYRMLMAASLNSLRQVREFERMAARGGK